MEIGDIHLYVCISFSMVHSHERLWITLTARQTGHSTRAGVALTNAADSSFAQTLWKNKLKRRRELERKARQNRSEIQKKKVGGKNNLKL